MSEPVEYLNSIDTTIMGSRNGHAALFMWYSLKKKGTYRLHKWDNSIFSSLSSLGQSQLTVVLFRYQGAWKRRFILFRQCQVFAPEITESWDSSRKKWVVNNSCSGAAKWGFCSEMAISMRRRHCACGSNAKYYTTCYWRICWRAGQWLLRRAIESLPGTRNANNAREYEEGYVVYYELKFSFYFELGP